MGEGNQDKPLRSQGARGTVPSAIKPASVKIGAAAAPISPSQLPVSSRTATLDDPLTTSLLAEVARRSRTIEVSPEQIDEANELAAADPAGEHEAGQSADNDPDQ